MKKLLTVFIFFLSTKIYSQNIEQFTEYLKGSNQVIFVTTPNWASTTGTCILYERKNENKKWKCISMFPVTVGKSGLAWDNKNRLPKYISQKIKHEGDGNSPAGIFSLGTVFSYYEIKNIHMPFKQVDANDICVDDINSVYYNTLIDIDSAELHDYASFENMRRNDALYEYGIWVNYNTDEIIPGNGSCIFLHIWKNETAPTSGCTAMSKENMLYLIRWLRENNNPVLLQVSAQ